MPISFKSSAKVPELLTHLGLDPVMFVPYTLDMGISEVRVVNDYDGVLVATIKPGTLISSLLKLSPSHPSCVLMRDLLMNVRICLNTKPNQPLGVCDADWLAKEKFTVPVEEVPDLTFTFENMYSTDDSVPTDNTSFTKNVEKAVEKAIEKVLSEADIKLILKSPVVPLRDATKLYQPVRGTSVDARYYVIGISKEGIKVAIKNPSSSISVRVEYEHDIPATVVSALGHFGISLKGNYMSGHFSMSHSTPTRFVGALLMDMGLEWITPLPNVKLLESAK